MELADDRLRLILRSKMEEGYLQGVESHRQLRRRWQEKALLVRFRLLNHQKMILSRLSSVVLHLDISRNLGLPTPTRNNALEKKGGFGVDGDDGEVYKVYNEEKPPS